MAARLGHVELAERYFQEAASIDLDDTMGNAAGGIHIAALGGIWQVTVFGFAGLALCPDGLRFEPHPPPSWRSLGFRVLWHGSRVHVLIEPPTRTLTATLEAGAPLAIHLGTQVHILRRDETWSTTWTTR
jgi:kojibiose phosphorylase